MISILYGTSTILQRYFDDISTIFFVDISSKYRWWEVEIWCFFVKSHRRIPCFRFFAYICTHD